VGLTSVVYDCPVDRVGLLIGRKGWVIKKLMQDSGAHFSINQSVREGADRKVIISGTPEAVAIAESYIKSILNPESSPGGGLEDFVPPISPRSQARDKHLGRFANSDAHRPASYPRHSSVTCNYEFNNGCGGGDLPLPSGSPSALSLEEQLALSLSVSNLYDSAYGRLLTPGSVSGHDGGLGLNYGIHWEQGQQAYAQLQMQAPRPEKDGRDQGSWHGQGPSAPNGRRTGQSPGLGESSKSGVLAEHLKLKTELVNSHPKARTVLTTAYAQSNAQIIRRHNKAMQQKQTAPSAGRLAGLPAAGKLNGGSQPFVPAHLSVGHRSNPNPGNADCIDRSLIQAGSIYYPSVGAAPVPFSVHGTGASTMTTSFSTADANADANALRFAQYGSSQSDWVSGPYV
jgi:hypothetical protein